MGIVIGELPHTHSILSFDRLRFTRRGERQLPKLPLVMEADDAKETSAPQQATEDQDRLK